MGGGGGGYSLGLLGKVFLSPVIWVLCCFVFVLVRALCAVRAAVVELVSSRVGASWRGGCGWLGCVVVAGAVTVGGDGRGGAAVRACAGR